LHSARKRGEAVKELTPGPSLGKRGEKKPERTSCLLPRRAPFSFQEKGVGG